MPQSNFLLLNNFLFGAAVMACWIAGLFFLRFWRKTSDRFFALFAAAFWMLGINWLLLVLVSPDYEFRALFYVIRLIAFMLIILAIWEKNRAARTGA